MGGNAKAMYLRMASSAVLPWLSADVGAKRSPSRADGSNQFTQSDGYHIGMATAAEVEQCMNCPYPECRNCQAHQRAKRRKLAAGELAESLTLRRCGKAEA